MPLRRNDPRQAVRLYLGDCLEVLRGLPDASVDAVVTDPPYGLGFMGKSWDTIAETANEKRWNKRERNLACETEQCVAGTARTGVTFAAPNPRCEKCGKVRRGHPDRVCTCPDFTPAPRENRQAQRFQEWCGDWAATCYRVTKPGGYLLSFGGTRTWHRLACAVEDAGWEIRDTLVWLYGQGMPKSKATLKPAWEPVLLARKPGPRVLPLNIEESRIPTTDNLNGGAYAQDGKARHDGTENWRFKRDGGAGEYVPPAGRWPPNVCLSCDCEGDGHDPDCPVALPNNGYGDSGGPSRFFYVAKASKRDRGADNRHPTVKSQALMRWLVGLVSFPGETVLDPFMGSGTTGLACLTTGRKFIGVESNPEYFAIATRRIAQAEAEALVNETSTKE